MNTASPTLKLWTEVPTETMVPDASKPILYGKVSAWMTLVMLSCLLVLARVFGLRKVQYPDAILISPGLMEAAWTLTRISSGFVIRGVGRVEM